MSRFLFWLVNHVPMGPLAPWVFGLAIGRRPHKVQAAWTVDRDGRVRKFERKVVLRGRP